MDYLPTTIYDAPGRQARGRKLNTIMEDHEATSFGMRSECESETDTSEGTIVGKPVAGNPKLYTAAPRKSHMRTAAYPVSPISESSTPASSAGSGIGRRSMRSSYADSDDGTVFSESCPSLAESGTSDATTFYTNSARSSLADPATGHKKYPGIVIPRDSWHSMDSPLKEVQFHMSPASKILLSPEVLSTLPKWTPEINTTPSLGTASSVVSESPSIPALSAPPTPDMRNMQVEVEEPWGGSHRSPNPGIALQIPEDHDHLHLMPQRHSVVQSESEWSSIVRHFPQIPGATPQENSPVTPVIKRIMDYREPQSATGVRLPDTALRTLRSLIREPSPSGRSDKTRSDNEEMEEGFNPPSRPRSETDMTPISDYSEYSFTQLSIPSPGGFFASLGAGSRHTWSFAPPKSAAPPSSATAENFYNAPWNRPLGTVTETVLEIDDTNLTEGPPTVRQAEFGPDAKSRKSSESDPSSETSDMYGPSSARHLESPKALPEIRYEYEEAYDDELKNAANMNMDRTSSWLAAQNTYLSALRETNPVNDMSDVSAVQHPSTQSQLQTEESESSASLTLTRNKSVRFDPTIKSPTTKPTPSSIATTKDPIFHQALLHHVHARKARDAVIAANPRLNLVNSLRLISPTTHYSSYLNGKLTLPPLTNVNRPKYSGPFSQNPRQTMLLGQPQPDALLAYSTLEKQQAALLAMQPHTWTVDALRYLYSGRLLASPEACKRLSTKSTTPLSSPDCVGKKRLRVLDLGGVPTNAAWAWQVACEWPNVKVYSVVTKQQATAAASTDGGIQGPPNHRTVSVPHLWSLPFRDNHFDVVSARSLHALLKSEPVPGVKGIDEFDMTLKEIMRVLKPGGYLDFMVMDSGIKGGGALGEKTSVEFGFMLKGMGYERDATRNWIQRLGKTGFEGTKRAWWALPMGRKTGGVSDVVSAGRDGGKTWKEAPRPMSEVSVRGLLDEYMDVEAVRGPVGSTREVADVAGLLGGWMWESWVVRVREERERRNLKVSAGGEGSVTVDEEKLMEGLAEVVEEGRRVGACWRVMSGWARKPRKNTKRKDRKESVSSVPQQQEQEKRNSLSRRGAVRRSTIIRESVDLQIQPVEEGTGTWDGMGLSRGNSQMGTIRVQLD